MLLLLFLMFTTVPILELMLLFRAGAVIGALPTLGIVLLTGFVGAYLARSQGRQIMFDIQKRLQAGEIPEYQVIAGFLVFAGGMLLLTPGFLTDILGLSMIFPLTRMAIIQFLQGQFKRAVASGNIHVYTSGSHGGFRTTRDPFSQSVDRPDHFAEDEASSKGGRVIDVKKIED